MEKDIEQIIARHLNGTSSQEEEQALTEWLGEKPENLKEYNESKKVWELAGQFNLQQFDAEEGWKKFKQKVELDEGPNVVPFNREKQDFPLLKIAATLAIIVSMGALFYYFSSKNSETAPLEYATSGEAHKEGVLLADGSKVWLNKNSRLVLSKSFGGEERMVTLMGEAFFEVAKVPGKPFVIETTRSLTTILGTSFNLKSYAGRQEEKLTMVTGTVQYYSKSTDHALNVTAGEEALILPDGNLKVVEMEDKNSFAWKTKRLEFKDAPFAQVVAHLEDYFGIKILLENKNLENCRFTGKFEHPQQEDVLNTISTVLGLEVEKKNNQIVFSGKGC